MTERAFWRGIDTHARPEQKAWRIWLGQARGGRRANRRRGQARGGGCTSHLARCQAGREAPWNRKGGERAATTASRARCPICGPGGGGGDGGARGKPCALDGSVLGRGAATGSACQGYPRVGWSIWSGHWRRRSSSSSSSVCAWWMRVSQTAAQRWHVGAQRAGDATAVCRNGPFGRGTG